MVEANEPLSTRTASDGDHHGAMTKSCCQHTEKVLTDSLFKTLLLAVAKIINVRRRSPRPRRHFHSSFTSCHDGPKCNEGGESRYVCTGSPRRCSLTTAPRRPRWSLQKMLAKEWVVSP